jgi:hypothetical protein
LKNKQHGWCSSSTTKFLPFFAFNYHCTRLLTICKFFDNVQWHHFAHDVIHTRY